MQTTQQDFQEIATALATPHIGLYISAFICDRWSEW